MPKQQSKLEKTALGEIFADEQSKRILEPYLGELNNNMQKYIEKKDFAAGIYAKFLLDNPIFNGLNMDAYKAVLSNYTTMIDSFQSKYSASKEYDASKE